MVVRYVVCKSFVVYCLLHVTLLKILQKVIINTTFLSNFIF